MGSGRRDFECRKWTDNQLLLDTAISEVPRLYRLVFNVYQRKCVNALKESIESILVTTLCSYQYQRNRIYLSRF